MLRHSAIARIASSRIHVPGREQERWPSVSMESGYAISSVGRMSARNPCKDSAVKAMTTLHATAVHKTAVLSLDSDLTGIGLGMATGTDAANPAKMNIGTYR